MEKAIRAVCLVVVAIMMCPPLFSQTANGRISGVIKDQTGGAIVGAMVTVTDVARGLARNLTSDEAGAYLAPNLLPGTYTVRATFTGFQAWERTNIALGVGGDIAIDATLLPGAQTQTVTITEELPMVNTTSATLGGTLDSQSIMDLPLQSRNFKNLLDLRPGTVTQLGNSSNGGGAQSVNGLRTESSNEFLVEGLHGMDPLFGQSIVGNLAQRGDGATVFPADAIQEFSQQFNAKAEYGWKAGASVNVGIKSGTNAIHGSAYAFFRAARLDGRDYYNDAGSQPKVNGVMQQFGATAGGPLKKDKLFFFVGYEQQDAVQGNTVGVNVAFTDLSLLTCTTGPYACTPIANSIAASRTPDASNHLLLACLGLLNAGGTLSPQSRSMVSLNPDCSPGTNYPNSVNGTTWFVPHGNDNGAPAASTGLPITTFYPNDQIKNRSVGGVAKVDYTLNDKNVINAFVFTGVGDNDGGTNKTLPIWGNRLHQIPIMIAGTWTWLPNSSWANSLRIGKARLAGGYRGFDLLAGQTSAQLGLATGVPTTSSQLGPGENLGYPQSLSLAGLNSMGSSATETRKGETLEISDQVNYLHGAHSLRLGGVLMTQQQNGGAWDPTRGTLVFGAAANSSASSSGLIGFLAGQNVIPAAAATINGTAINRGDLNNFRGLQSASLSYGNPESHVRRMAYSLFAQDDWRIRPRLTLNLGIRYDLMTVPHDRDLILGSFDPNLGLVQEGIQITSVSRPDHNNFGPRVGFAWDMFGNGKTVLRVGGSMIYDLTPLVIYVETSGAVGAQGNPTGWVIGCSAPTSPAASSGSSQPVMPAGQATNCPGMLLTSGGTRDVGLVSWSEGNNNILNVVNWDGPINGTSSGIYPGTSVLNCSPSILVKDNVSSATSPSRAGGRCAVTSVDPHLVTPYVETWSLSIQQAITHNLVLETAYVGNHGTKLIGRIDLNQPVDGSGWTPALIATCLTTMTSGNCNGNSGASNALELLNQPFHTKFPYLSQIVNITNPDTSNYDGLQMTLTARNLHGLSLTSGYTFARANDVASTGVAGVQSDAYNVGRDYGRATNDIRHRFTLATTYQVPGVKGYAGLLRDWKLNGIFRYQTGSPWNPAATNDFGGTGSRGNNISRWDFAGNTGDFAANYYDTSVPQFFAACGTSAVTDPNCNILPSGINPRTGAAYTSGDMAINNPICQKAAASPAPLRAFGCWVQGGSAITAPYPGVYGNMAKGLFDGPKYWAADFSVTKKQQITERFSAEFRAETFNTFNHPAFAQPSGSLACNSSGCAFGTSSQTPAVSATNAFLGTGGPRRMQFGVKIIF